MKGIVLAGGLGTRLHSLTGGRNKHLLPVDGRPMVHYPLRSLVDAGIDDVVVVTGAEHVEPISAELGDGAALGLRRLSVVPQAGARGVADALRCAESSGGADPVCVVLGDQIFGGSLREPAATYARAGAGAMVLLHRVDDARPFGVARFESDRLVEIVEKPADPPSALAVTGVYFFDHRVFEFCGSLRPSERGELEITSVNNVYLERGEMSWMMLDGWWVDVGTVENLRRAESLLRADRAAGRRG